MLRTERNLDAIGWVVFLVIVCGVMMPDSLWAQDPDRAGNCSQTSRSWLTAFSMAVSVGPIRSCNSGNDAWKFYW